MKMKVVFSFSTVLVAILFCCNLNQVQAQSGSLSGSGGTTTSKTPMVEYCDVRLPVIEKQLKDDANATCTTQSACVECMDRTSKLVLAATLVVQPDNADCKPVSNIETVVDAKSRGGSVPTTPRFTASIIQSPCFNGGTNLEVYVPGHSLTNREFAFLWEVDGIKAGHLPSVQCACGKEAKVRVTYLPTGETVNLAMKLNATCGGSIGK